MGCFALSFYLKKKAEADSQFEEINDYTSGLPVPQKATSSAEGGTKTAEVSDSQEPALSPMERAIEQEVLV